MDPFGTPPDPNQPAEGSWPSRPAADQPAPGAPTGGWADRSTPLTNGAPTPPSRHPRPPGNNVYPGNGYPAPGNGNPSDGYPAPGNGYPGSSYPGPGAPGHPIPGNGYPGTAYAPIPPSPPAMYRAATPPVATPPPWYRRVIAGVIVLALLAGLGAVVFRQQLFPAKTHPDQWDARVTDLVAFVEKTRGLTFEHPVAVNFLSENDFVHLFDQPGGGASEEQAKAYSGLFNAEGLAVDYDVNAGDSTVSTVTTIGLYMPDVDKVYVRGSELTPAVRVVLAHELTHALQAQHFTLRLNGPDDLQVRSIVEADAMRVEDAYTATLSQADRDAVDAANTLSSDSEDQLADVPWAVVEQRYAPYVLGPDLIADVFAKRGNAGIDALLRDPPSEDVLLDPWTLDNPTEQSAVTVLAPVGRDVIDPPQAMSELQMLVMLDAWLPWSQARGALDGWQGAQYVTYWGPEVNTMTGESFACLTARVRVPTGRDEFKQAIRDWADASGSDARPVVHGDDVEFTACDRGSGAKSPPKPVVSPLRALMLEHEAVGLAGEDPTDDQIKGYQCFAARLIDDPIAAPLVWLQDRTDEQQSAFHTQSDLAADACGVPRITSTP